MNADSAFYIGASHDVCEDYATHLNNDNSSLAIVADGCSGSPNTDFGSRLLAVSLFHAQKQFNFHSPHMLTNVITRARTAVDVLELHPDTIDATLLALKSDKDGEFKGVLAGDGVLAVKQTNQRPVIFRFEYPSGYPYFLNYELHKYRKENWKTEGALKVHEKIEDTEFYELQNLDMMDIYSEDQQINLIDDVVYFNSAGRRNIEWVVVMSDGAESFYEEVPDDTGNVNRREIPLEEVVEKALAFKNLNGSFIKRRMNRFKQDCKKWGWHHYDDFSVSGISFGGKK